MERIYELYYENKLLKIGLNICYLILVLFSVLFVTTITKEIQDALLTILSIIFPLIAGFLTFGKDLLKNITKKIDTIIQDDIDQTDRPTTDLDKEKIADLQNMSSNFTDIIIKSFKISFLLIIFIIISKFNCYYFKTDVFELEITAFIQKNWTNLLLKSVFFVLLYKLLFNTLYFMIFISSITKNEEG